MDLNRLVREWGAAATTAVAVALAALFQAIYQGPPAPDRHFYWLLLAIVCAVTAAVVPNVDAVVRRRQRRRRQRDFADRLKEARSDAVVAINDALDPLVETMGQLAAEEPHERDGVLMKLITQALNSAAQVIGPERTRVNFFVVDTSGPQRRLVCEHYSAGRAGQPSTVFTEGRPDGDFAFRLLENDEPYLCANVTKAPPPGWDASRERGYITFISVPARVGKDSRGMVTADSLEEGDLAEQDIPLLRVIGTIIAASMLFSSDR